MNLRYTDEFRKEFKKLPADIARLYYRQEAFFRENWRDPRLHTKKLTGNPILFSFRITRGYRALFFFADDATTILATIGNRKDVYRRKRL